LGNIGAAEQPTNGIRATLAAPLGDLSNFFDHGGREAHANHLAVPVRGLANPRL